MRHPRRPSIVGLAGGMVAGAAIGLVGVLAFTQSPEQASAGRAVPTLPAVTAQITSQRLTESVDAPCEPSATKLSTVAPLSAARYRRQVVTAVEVSPGDQLRSGTLVAGISGRPLISFVTSVPFFRDLKIGDRGVDVQGLEEGLLAAGRIKRADQTFDRQTAAALSVIYRKAGLDTRGVFLVDSAWAVPAGSRVSAVRVAVGDVVSRKDELVIALAGSRDWRCHVRGGLDVSALTTLEARADGAKTTLKVTKSSVDAESGESVLTVEPRTALKPDAELMATVISTDTGKAVLSVPAGAIFATGTGSPAVRILENGNQREVPVEVGVAAGGWIEVGADQLVAGQDVVIRGSE